MTIQELLAEYARLSDANKQEWDKVFNAWEQQNEAFQSNAWQASQQAYNPYAEDFNQANQHQQEYAQYTWHTETVNVDEYLRDLGLAFKPAPTTHRPIDKAERIREINGELDILRGRVPTPKGYNVDPRRAKDLMAELKQLNEH